MLLGIFVAIGAAPVGGKLGFEFFPKDDSSEFIVEIDTPPGSSLEYTRLKSEEVAAMARAIPEVRYTYTTIGGQGGAVDQGSVYVRLLPKADRERGQEEIASALRERAKRVGGATAALGTGNFGGTKQIMIQLQGPDIAVLNRLAEQVRGAGAAGARRRGRLAEHQGAEAGAYGGPEPRAGGQPGGHGGAGGAGAAPGLRRHRRGRLGGPQRRDA